MSERERERSGKREEFIDDQQVTERERERERERDCEERNSHMIANC